MPKRPVIHRKFVVFGCAAALLIPVVAVVTFGLIMSDATSYCPWQHHLSDLSSCEVLDKRDGRVLLQHGDLDINVYYLEIVENSGTRTAFELPSQVGQLAPQGYSARLITGSANEIVFNGSRLELVALR